MIKRFEYYNESLRDKMIGKSKNEVDRKLEENWDKLIVHFKEKYKDRWEDAEVYFDINHDEIINNYFLEGWGIDEVIEEFTYGLENHLEDLDFEREEGMYEGLKDKMIPKTKSDIKYIPNNQYIKTKPISASNLKNGSIRCTYDKLVELFGNPTIENWTPRMNFCWYLIDENNDNNYIEIYDWNDVFVSANFLKTGEHLWDVKGINVDAVNDVINYISYNSLNEGLKDKMVGKSDDDIIKALKNMTPYKAVVKAEDVGASEEIMKKLQDDVDKKNEEFENATKKYNKENFGDFLQFISEWLTENGFNLYDVTYKFESRLYELYGITTHEYDIDEDDGGYESSLTTKYNDFQRIFEDEEEEEEEEIFEFFYDKKIPDETSVEDVISLRDKITKYTLKYMKENKPWVSPEPELNIEEEDYFAHDDYVPNFSDREIVDSDATPIVTPRRNRLRRFLGI